MENNTDYMTEQNAFKSQYTSLPKYMYFLGHFSTIICTQTVSYWSKWITGK